MEKILFIHGLASDRNSTTGKRVKEILSDYGEVICEDFSLDGKRSLLSDTTRVQYTGTPTGIPDINIEILEEVLENLQKQN